MEGWLFRRFILRRLIRNPIRALLLAIAVGFATTLVVSVYRVSVAGVASFEESLGYSAAEYPLAIVPRGGGIQLKHLGSCLAPLRDSFAIAAYRRVAGELVTGRTRTAVGVVGVGGFDDTHAAPALKSEILMSGELRHEYGISPGQEVQLVLPSVTLQGPVEDSAQFGRGLNARGVVVPLSRLFSGALEPLVDAILLRPYGDASIDHYRASLVEWLSSCGSLPGTVGIESSAGRLEQSESLIAAYRFNVMIMAGMALLICVLLISQATQLSLRNISRELSLLRTLGVGRAVCLSSVILEGGLLGAMGALLGVTIGEPLTLWITQHFLQTAHDIYGISLGSIGSARFLQTVVIVSGMIAVCVAGAAFGGMEALRVAPSLGTRSEHAGIKPISRSWALTLARVSIAGFACALLAAFVSESPFFAYLFVAACMGAVAGITPYAILSAVWCFTHGPNSVLLWWARGGIRARGRSFLLGAIGASLGITLICALSLMVGSFRTTLQAWAAQRLQGDLFVSSAIEGQGNDARIPSEIEGRVRLLNGVRRVVPYFEIVVSQRGMPLVVSASDLATQVDRGVYVLRAGTLDRQALAAGRGALVSESAARKLGLWVGDVFPLEGREFEIVGVVQEFGTEHPLVQIDRSLFNQIYPGTSPKNLTIDLVQGTEQQEVRSTIATLVGAVGIVRDNSELRALVLQLFDRTFQVTLSIRWIVFCLALLGLLLASIQHLWERRREVKTMHVLGFSPAQILGAQVIEVTAVCAVPVLVGVCGGVALGWGLTNFLNPRAFGWSLNFTLSLTPLTVAVGFLSGLVIVVGIGTRIMLSKTIKEATLADE